MAKKSPPIEIKFAQSRDNSGKFSADDEPLVNLTVQNPIANLKRWFEKILGREGIDIRLKIHPLTAISIAAVIALGSFGLGWITQNAFVKEYLPYIAPTPTPIEVSTIDTAFTGVVRYSTQFDRYYLERVTGETVSLSAPSNISLSKLVGKRILAVGVFNINTKVLEVTDASDLEILPLSPSPVPTSTILEINPSL
jgi:hypothetical protein